MTEPRWKHLGFSSQQSFAGTCGSVNRKIKKINSRRFQLIDKQVDGLLADGEEEELEQLQQQLHDLIEIIAPLPMVHLKKLEKQLQDAEQRVEDRKNCNFCGGKQYIRDPRYCTCKGFCHDCDGNRRRCPTCFPSETKTKQKQVEK